MQETGAAHRALMVSGLASFVLLGLMFPTIGLVLPVFQTRFDMNTAQAGWLVSGFWFGCLTGVAGMFLGAGKVGPRPGLAAIGIGAAMMAFSPWWPVTVLGGALFGGGYGSLATVFNPRILVAFGARGPAMMSLMNAIFSLGAIAAPQMFLWLSSDTKPAFLLIAAFAGIIWLFSGTAGHNSVGAATAYTGYRLHWPILIFGMLGIGIEASLASLGPTALILASVPPEESTRLLLLFFVAYLVARLVLVTIANRVPAFIIYTAAMVILTISSTGAVISSSPAFFFPPMGISASLFFHSFFVTATQKMGGDARVPAIIIGSGLIGAVILPLVCTQLIGGMGDRGFFWLILAMAGMLAVVSALMLPRMIR